jgi:uncharacterized integral membrane protein (TIGR00698 family)
MANVDFIQSRSRALEFGAFIPGVVLVAVITAAAYGLRGLPYVSVLSPMITSILIGMLVANSTGVPASARPGLAICGKRLLRAAVALLGLQLTFTQVGQIGVTGVAEAAIALASTFVFTLLVGRFLGVERGLRYALAGGVSICGASAVAAVGSAVRARDEDVSYAVACITIFGTIAMFLYPVLKSIVGLEASPYGQWVGLSVHEVAQVVGASFQGGSLDGEIAIVTKLARVMMLAPMVIVVSLLATRRVNTESNNLPGATPFPIFIIAFIVLVFLNSFGLVPAAVHDTAISITPILLSAALGALGLGTRFDQIRARGIRPLALAGLSTLFIASVSLLMVKLTA